MSIRNLQDNDGSSLYAPVMINDPNAAIYSDPFKQGCMACCSGTPEPTLTLSNIVSVNMG